MYAVRSLLHLLIKHGPCDPMACTDPGTCSTGYECVQNPLPECESYEWDPVQSRPYTLGDASCAVQCCSSDQAALMMSIAVFVLVRVYE